ncbi:hypothetical protein [Synechococcus sp. CCY9202]|uniref:hypothetical protein n=1 Tax=Synechococcus sp. CCY9202 TaxID=174698 RepID=UPI002B1FA050|nr:hypothetical protein [Synechococcus sp. CCY9202]
MDNAFNLPGAQILLTGVPSGGVSFVSLPSERPENHVANFLSDDVSSTQRDRFKSLLKNPASSARMSQLPQV